MKKVFLLVIAMLATLWASAGIVQGTIGNGSYLDWDNTTSTQYGIDFNNDGNLEFRIYSTTGANDISLTNCVVAYNYSSGNNIWTGSTWDAIASIAYNTSIGSTGNWASEGDAYLTDGYDGTPYIPQNQDCYVGFLIKINGNTHYGWAKVRLVGTTATWSQCAYETTPNTPINAGATGGVTPTTYTIAVSANPTGAGNVTGGGTYNQGASVTVSATANSGYTFQNWTENGNIVSTNATYTFSATANRTLVANFQQNSTPSDTYTVTTFTSPVGSGYTLGEWDDVAGSLIQFPAGSTVTLEAVAYSGYTFLNWTENTANGTIVSTSAIYSFTINSNRILYANFTTGGSSNTISISATANPTEGGTITGAGNYDEGAFVTLVATPNNGYRFVNWTENGIQYSTNATYTFNAWYNRNIVANFELVSGPTTSYTITATFGEHGNISPAGTVTYQAGETAYYMINPDEGYVIDELKIDNANIETTTFYVFENISANHTIHATFRTVTAIEENVAPELIITSENLLVNVRNAENENVTIYDMNGRVIAAGIQMESERSYAVPTAGIYIVKVGVQVRKIAVIE